MKRGLNTSNVYIMNSFLGETVPLTVTVSSTNVTFALAASIRNYDVMAVNAGPNTAFVGFGVGSGTTAQLPGTNGTTNAFPILAGAIVTLQKNSDAVMADTCAAICAAGGTATIYFTSIQGS